MIHKSKDTSFAKHGRKHPHREGFSNWARAAAPLRCQLVLQLSIPTLRVSAFPALLPSISQRLKNDTSLATSRPCFFQFPLFMAYQAEYYLP